MSWNRKQGDAKKQAKTRQRNYVAKHAHEFNKAATHVDRKKAEKRGKRKHKGQWA